MLQLLLSLSCRRVPISTRRFWIASTQRWFVACSRVATCVNACVYQRSSCRSARVRAGIARPSGWLPGQGETWPCSSRHLHVAGWALRTFHRWYRRCCGWRQHKKHDEGGEDGDGAHGYQCSTVQLPIPARCRSPLGLCPLWVHQRKCSEGSNDFRSAALADMIVQDWAGPLSARKRHMHRSKPHHYSITSSARASSVGGTARPSAVAVLRLTTSSNFVGCTTGRSLGFSPLRMRPV